MRRYTVLVDDTSYVIDVKEMESGRFRVRVDGKQFEVELSAEEDIPEAIIRPEIVPETEEAPAPPAAPPAAYRPPKPETLRPLPGTPQPPQPEHRTGPDEGAANALVAPMPGVILSVAVTPGEQVTRGQTLLVLEAMKMKNPLRASRDAVVAAVLVQAGQAVGYGHTLVRFKEG